MATNNTIYAQKTKLLALLATILSAQQAIALPPLETKGLTKAEEHLLKQYAGQRTFERYFSKDGDYPEGDGKIDVVYTSDLNRDRLTDKFVTRTFLMRSCAAKMLNEKLGKEYIVTGDDECYSYAFTNAAGIFNTHILTEHRQVFNFHNITDNAYTCAELGSCSNPSSKTFTPADLSNVYAIFVSYYNQCTSDSCRVDMALVAYSTRFYSQQLLLN